MRQDSNSPPNLGRSTAADNPTHRLIRLVARSIAKRFREERTLQLTETGADCERSTK